MPKRRYQTGKLAKRRRRLLIIKIVIFTLFLVTLVGGTAFWSHSDKLTISKIEVEGTKFVSEEEIVSIAENLMTGKYLFGYAKDNALLAPRGKIKRDILDTYLSLEDVAIKMRSLDKISIVVSEYEPVAKWCDLDGDCYFVNNKGEIFLEEPVVNSYRLISLNNVVEGDPLGQLYISEKFVTDILKFNEYLSDIEVNITSVSTEDEETFKLDTPYGLYFLIDKSDDVDIIFENLLTALDQEAIHKAQLKNIEYIDLRFGNKVIYKPKEWE